MPVLRHLLWASTFPKYRAFCDATQTPERAQEKVWREVQSAVANGRFWKTTSRKLEDFDITDYEDYRAAIDEGFRTSTVSPLTGDPVLFFAESAGTSNVPKRFPMTRLFREQFQRTTPPFIHGLLSDFPTLLSAPILYFAAVAGEERSPQGVEVGFISHFNYRHMPSLVRRMYGFPLEVFRDHATFIEFGPLYALATDLSAMIAVTPGQLLLFFDQLRDRRRELLAALERGGRPAEQLPAIRVTASRLDLLRRVLSRDSFTLHDLFPSLVVVTTWRAATCGLQAEVLRPRLGANVALRDATYSATEGWVNVPRGPGIGGAVQPLAHVVEFCEAGIQSPTKRDLLPLQAVEAGRDYEIFLTTAMGMIRYRLYDVVHCSGRLGRTPVLSFQQKAASQISLGLVQIAESELVRAMNEARFEPRSPWFFAPNEEGDGLLFCHASGLDPDPEGLALVHRALATINQYYGDYAAKRLVAPLRSRELPTQHDAWQTRAHAQVKPKILRTEPLAPRRA